MTEGKAFEGHLKSSQQRYRPPPGAREILLVRHGSTDGTKLETLEFGEITLSNPPLLPRGHVQARAVCERLRRETLTRIFVTPLWRTHQTAAPLAEATGLAPVVVEELREVYLGEWEHDFSARAASGDPLLKQMMAEESFDVLPGAETMAAFGARITAGIARIVEATEPDSASVAFLHAGTIAEICRQAAASRPFAFIGPENTSLSRLVVKANGTWALRSFNDVAHLEAAGL